MSELRKNRLVAVDLDASIGQAPSPEADHERRVAIYDLIDKQIDGVITPDERLLLESLQQRLRRYVNKVAPLPLEQLRKLHQELLEKAAKATAHAV